MAALFLDQSVTSAVKASNAPVAGFWKGVSMMMQQAHIFVLLLVVFEAMVDVILNDAMAFGGDSAKRDDDMTVVVVKVQ